MKQQPKSPSSSRQRGASTIEYVLLAAGIAAIIGALVTLLDTGLTAAFTDLCNLVSPGACT